MAERLQLPQARWPELSVTPEQLATLSFLPQAGAGVPVGSRRDVAAVLASVHELLDPLGWPSELVDRLADATSRVAVAAVSGRNATVTVTPVLLRDRDGDNVRGFRVEITGEGAWLQALETAEPTGLTQRRGVLDSDRGIWLETDVVDTDGTPRLPERPEPVLGACIPHVVDGMLYFGGRQWHLQGGANDFDTVQQTAGAKLVLTDARWGPDRGDLPEHLQSVAPVVALATHLWTHPKADIAWMVLHSDADDHDDHLIMLEKVKRDRIGRPHRKPVIIVYDSDAPYPMRLDKWAKYQHEHQTFGHVDQGFHILFDTGTRTHHANPAPSTNPSTPRFSWTCPKIRGSAAAPAIRTSPAPNAGTCPTATSPARKSPMTSRTSSRRIATGRISPAR